ncbi:hypothetical protein K0G60_04985 [Bacteroides fragilis]|nr:hypothetical protein [Bacteroides fragilis]
MSSRTQKSVSDGLGIDLPSLTLQGIGRPIPFCCPKEGRSRGLRYALSALPCRLGAKVGRFPWLKYGSKTPQAATTAPNAAMHVKKSQLPACRLSDLPPGRHSCPPACLPACQSARPCACRHAGIGTVQCQRAKIIRQGNDWKAMAEMR